MYLCGMAKRSIYTGVVKTIDDETGEILASREIGGREGGSDEAGVALGGYYFMVYEAGIGSLVGLGVLESWLIYGCAVRMNRENLVYLDGWQWEYFNTVQRDNSMTSRMSRAYRGLFEKGLLVRVKGESKCYMVSPFVFYRGRTRYYNGVVRKWDKEIKISHESRIRKKRG